MACADFASGLVHWSADTWGNESMPLLGKRFLRPFRIHHLNPDDFLLRDFVDTNGDVSMLLLPLLVATACTPADSPHTVAAILFAVAFAAGSCLTNQVHQWAHMPRPPRLVRVLQHHGIILGRDAHERHHAPPFARNYCIATGWLNAPLTAVGFFPSLERLVTLSTGLRPREDDACFYSERPTSRP